MSGLGLPELIIIAIIGIIIVLLNWKMYLKAGFSGWWSLLMMVLVTNVLLEHYLAFAELPIHRELLILRKQAETERF